MSLRGAPCSIQKFRLVSAFALAGFAFAGFATPWLAAQSVPAATPATSATLPSVPAASAGPETQLPSTAPAISADGQPLPAVAGATPDQQTSSPSDLQKPIVVPPGPPAVPAAVPMSPANIPSVPAFDFEPHVRSTHDSLGSVYIPVDSWVYPEALRLYSMGFLDSAFIGLRPWTRRSLLHMLEKSSDDIMASNNEEAQEILASLDTYLADEGAGFATPNASVTGRGIVYGVDTTYTRLMGITGPTLRDSYHLGQTIVNDYGRPYASGFNNLTGFSTTNEWGRFSLYIRGEYQHSPARDGYSYALASQLTQEDLIGTGPPPTTFYQDTIPYGNTGAQNPFRLDEAYLSFHFLGHEISGGKSDAWQGPGFGGAFAWSNNAENIYSFRINRVEPLVIPLLHYLIGPVRYDFFYGSLKGHNVPNNPWVHSEQISFRPTKNVEFAFQRTIIFGGHGFPRTSPVTLHTFLKGFFDVNDTTTSEKYSRSDPGARFSAFSFSWRLPFLTRYVTLYTDSEAHDDVSPISAPRRAAYRPGLYISQFPHLPKLDFRIEGVSTDYSTLRSQGGEGNYFEIVQEQGYTNKGFIMGDWIGREAKGGQAWLTWHLSGNEFIQVEYLNKKTPKDFIAGGTTQNQFKIDVVKRLGRNLELNAWYQFERWKAPVPLANPAVLSQILGGPLYYPNAQNDSVLAAQFTWYPKLHRVASLNGK